MNSVYAFLFCIGLGIAARLVYLAATLLAKKTDLMPVTVALDTAVVAIVGAAFTAFIILSGTTLAPYQFAALGGGYYLAFMLTRKPIARPEKKKRRK